MKRTAEELFAESEAAYKRGRAFLLDGKLEYARVQAIRVGEWALKAKNAGLPLAKFNLALRARDALITGYWTMRLQK